MSFLEMSLAAVAVLMYLCCGLATLSLARRFKWTDEGGYFFIFLLWPFFLANVLTFHE